MGIIILKTTMIIGICMICAGILILGYVLHKSLHDSQFDIYNGFIGGDLKRPSNNRVFVLMSLSILLLVFGCILALCPLLVLV